MSKKIETLAILMDEKQKEISPLLQKLFSFQDLIENKLVPSIEKVHYENKYKLIDNMRNITNEISFYLQAPYLIGKKVYGIYHINNDRVAEAIKTLLGDKFKGKKRKYYFCPDVPTIIYPETENDMISALNIADISITIGKSDYYDVVNLEYNERLELGDLLRFISLPSSIIDKNTAYILIPEKMHKENKYSRAIYDSIDHLIVFDSISENEMRCFSNLKEITVVGKKPNKEITEYSKLLELSLHTSNTVKKYCTNSVINNFEYKYIIENFIYEISGYLADRKKTLTESIAVINKDLMFKDTNTEKVLKNIQCENSNSITNIDNIYKEFKNISDDLIAKIDEIQQEECINLSAAICYHRDIKSVLLDLIIKMGNTFSQYPCSRSKELMRNRVKAYESMGGNTVVSSVIYAQAVGNCISNEYLEKFRNYDTCSEFVIKKMLDMSEKLKLTYSEKERLIFLIKETMRPGDKRMLAEAYYKMDKHLDVSKSLFFDALEYGDEEAGNLLIRYFKLSNEEITKLAEYGNAEACYRIATKEENDDYPNTFKYLVISAAKGHLNAIKALGNFYYFKYLGTENNNYINIALSIYKIAHEKGSNDKKMFEYMAEIAYHQKDYKSAIDYSEKSDTANANYILGQIYEKGSGCSMDKRKAYKYYEIAIEKGNINAQVCLDKLDAEFKAKAQKQVVKENTNYAATTYYSGYYSSYYSGW